MNRYLKSAAALVVLLLTVLGFIYYFLKHPDAVSTLTSLNLSILIELVVLYLFIIIMLGLILDCSLKLAGLKMSLKENLLLTIYSTIVNFFGPLQSGPGIRAVYLKKRFGLKIKSFLLITLLYYAFFAFISAIFLFIFSRPLWQALGFLVLFSCLVVVSGFYILKNKLKIPERIKLDLSLLLKLFILTLIQLGLVAIVYYIELHSINRTISFKQALTYTGAANFALFVSLTPGAIGFREAFLLISQRLHHISTTNILAASLIDRAVYVFFLGILFIVALGSHAKDKLKI